MTTRIPICEFECALDGDRVSLSGHVVIVLAGELRF
jgi:hypothetical protein